MYCFCCVYLASNAGFHQTTLISEPSAAVISYFFDNKEEMEERIKNKQDPLKQTWLLGDIGGGTTDFTKIDVRCQIKNNYLKWNFTNVYTTGDNFLGGRDFTDCIVTILKNKLHSKGVNINEFTDYDHALLWSSAEKMKLTLSTNDTAYIFYPFNRQRYQLLFTRTEFKNAVQSLNDKFIAKLDKCVQNQHIDYVLIVGGSSFCTFLSDSIHDSFKATPIKTVANPRDAVAIGAAFVGAIRLKHYNSVTFIACSSHNIGIELDDNTMHSLIRIGDRLPFCSIYDDLWNTDPSSIRINVYEGNNLKAQNNHFLASATLHLNPPQEPGTATLVLCVCLDINGELTIDAWLRGDEQHKAVIKTHTGLNIGDFCPSDQSYKLASIEFEKHQIIKDIKFYLDDLKYKTDSTELEQWNNASVLCPLQILQQDLIGIKKLHDSYANSQQVITTATIKHALLDCSFNAYIISIILNYLPDIDHCSNSQIITIGTPHVDEALNKQHNIQQSPKSTPSNDNVQQKNNDILSVSPELTLTSPPSNSHELTTSQLHSNTHKHDDCTESQNIMSITTSCDQTTTKNDNMQQIYNDILSDSTELTLSLRYPNTIDSAHCPKSENSQDLISQESIPVNLKTSHNGIQSHVTPQTPLTYSSPKQHNNTLTENETKVTIASKRTIDEVYDKQITPNSIHKRQKTDNI